MTESHIEALVARLRDGDCCSEMGCNCDESADVIEAQAAELAQVKAERDALADACQRARAYINGPGTDRTKPILRQLDDALTLRKEPPHDQ